MERGDIGGWLSGPGSTRDALTSSDGQVPYRPGERLGRPLDGPGSIAGFGRRLAGLTFDWGCALLIASGVMRPLQWGSLAPLVALLAINVLLVGTAGFTLGHRLFGMRVETVPGGHPGPIRALIRSLLLCLAFPALIWDKDTRGLHDKAAGTLVARR